MRYPRPEPAGACHCSLLAAVRENLEKRGHQLTVFIGASTVGDCLDDMPRGAVAVLDNPGRLDCTVWGGIVSRLATPSV